MPRRIEIELTSRTEGSWTWRAAGAKQPKGTLSGELVPDHASVGDVLRAEVESGLDGIEVVALAALPTKASDRAGDRIEVLGAPRRGPDVSVTLAPGSRRRDGGQRGARRDGDRRDGRQEGREGGRHEAAGRHEGGGHEGGGRRQGDARREAGSRRPEAATGPGRRGAPRAEGARERERDRRPAVSTVHRNAMLASLGPEQLPVAEQLLRGGIPAVRNAIAEQRKGQGAQANAAPLLAMAEQLLPAVNLASWKDRATAAQAAGKELRLRELRAVVTASRTVTLDDEGRALAKALREALDHRVTALREEWVARIANAVRSGRVLDAVRSAARPPEPATRLPAELAVNVAEAAGAAMTAELDPGAWLDLLAAVVDSPVRRNVKPAGIPPAPEAHDAARHAAGLVPELAKLLGLRIPPPPPRRSPPRASAGRVSAGGGGGRAAAL